MPAPSLSQGSPATSSPREVLFARDPRCSYCGRKFRRLGQSTADHIVPRSKGGSTHLGNLALACKPCQIRKDDLTPCELLRWSLRVLLVSFVVRTQGGG